VETFIDAKPISDYVEVKHRCNPIIAKKGMEILYRMIFYENFVHGDCHAGNILVQLKEGKSVAKLSLF
jgi:aarF domain-containing kinase